MRRLFPLLPWVLVLAAMAALLHLEAAPRHEPPAVDEWGQAYVQAYQPFRVESAGSAQWCISDHPGYVLPPYIRTDP